MSRLRQTRQTIVTHGLETSEDASRTFNLLPDQLFSLLISLSILLLLPLSSFLSTSFHSCKDPQNQTLTTRIRLNLHFFFLLFLHPFVCLFRSVHKQFAVRLLQSRQHRFQLIGMIRDDNVHSIDLALLHPTQVVERGQLKHCF